MAQEILLAYNEISRKAVATSASSENSDYPHENALQGAKTTYWQTSGAVTESSIVWDLGASGAQGVDYLIISGLLHILALTPGQLDIELRASTDNFSVSDDLIDSQTDVQEGDLVGTYGEDFLLELGSTSSSYRYWKVVFSTTNSVIHKVRSIALGLYYDFGGRSPSYPYQLSQNSNAGNKGFESDAGTVFKTSSGRARRQYVFVWKKITDAVRETFFEEIAQFTSDFPIWIVQPSDASHEVLPDRLILAWASFSYNTNENWKNLGMVEGTFLEDILG